MARIAGVELPRNKRVDVALTYIYGIGRTTALKICDAAGVDWTKNIDSLDDNELNVVRRELETNYKVEGDLRRDVTGNIKRIPEDFVGAIGAIEKPYTMNGLQNALSYISEAVAGGDSVTPPPGLILSNS